MTAEPVGQVVDTASAREFMREALEQIEEDELLAIAGEAERKSAGFRRLLSAAAIEHLAPDGQRRILRSVFATRRKAAAVAESTGPEQFRSLAAGLLYGPGPIADRFDSFCRALPEADGYLAWDLGSELLHYTQPEAYWLWNRWLWDPRINTGALPLVTMQEYDLRAPTTGQMYLKVGQAIAFVNSTGEAAGFKRASWGLFGTDVFLACVYIVYLYTVTRMRMTREFNQVIPPLPDIARRLLGVHRMEV